ncbi:MAG: 1-deoxy-D-xylulose-5-phosphate reductoisomerase [Gammaproteobacteria bacterium]|nr:1-deoxy-D-xylulose-5-phosphate reductoisomerase [Gammaproteobacteria bacterium]
MQGLCVLGATGTVGRNTLDVARRHPDKLRVAALAAGRDADGLFELCREFRPRLAALADPAAAARLRERLAAAHIRCEVLAGPQGLEDVARAPDATQVMSAIVGAAGLLPTLAAVRAGKRVLIANKEPLVMAGALVMAEAARHGATIIPIDSEHNAIFQCLSGGVGSANGPKGVARLILTGSGGPFRETPLEQLAAATPEQAVRHPNWVMGPKISVDSATMMNKGLELIEARQLFGVAEERIDVVLHPESVIHSLVEFVDGSTLAQLGQPDMRVPIAHALAWPERWESGVGGLDFARLRELRFSTPDARRYPCLGLARAVLRQGGALANVLNAANEIAVEAFLGRRIGFTGIAELIERTLDAAAGAGLPAGATLDEALAVDRWAREWAGARLRGRAAQVAGHA